jgi:hemoglobin
MQPTAFARLGGFAKVRLLVSEFYDRVLETPRLSPYFRGVDMRRLVDHQTKFFSSIMGGPATFTDEHLERAHRHLRITPEHFDEMGEVLADTLEDAGVDDAIIERIIGQFTAVRERIVNSAGTITARSA